MAEKYREGALIAYRVSSDCQYMAPDDIAALAAQMNIPSSIVPPYAGDHEAAQRAISRVRSAWSRKGKLLTAIKSTKELLLIAVVDVVKDAALERVDYNQDDTFRWSVANNNGDTIIGTHEIARQVDTEYQALKGMIGPADWSQVVVDYLLNVCRVELAKDVGHLYWCPPAHLPKVQHVAAFLEKVGIQVAIMEVDGGSKTMVVSAAQDGLSAQLERLQEEVQAFTGNERADTLRARIEAYQDLRKRCTMYTGVLGIATEKIEKMTLELESQVETLVTIADHKPDVEFLKTLAGAGDEALRTALEKGAIKTPKPLPDKW